MKRFGNLYDRICDLDNIYLAYTKARKGKSKTYGVVNFEKELIKYYTALVNKLKTEKGL